MIQRTILHIIITTTILITCWFGHCRHTGPWQGQKWAPQDRWWCLGGRLRRSWTCRKPWQTDILARIFQITFTRMMAIDNNVLLPFHQGGQNSRAVEGNPETKDGWGGLGGGGRGYGWRRHGRERWQQNWRRRKIVMLQLAHWHSYPISAGCCLNVKCKERWSQF